jgi:hypothetical protein
MLVIEFEGTAPMSAHIDCEKEEFVKFIAENPNPTFQNIRDHFLLYDIDVFDSDFVTCEDANTIVVYEVYAEETEDKFLGHTIRIIKTVPGGPLYDASLTDKNEPTT